MAYENELKLAKELAVKAGEKVLEIYESGDFGTTLKDDERHSHLTKADIASNEIIVKELRFRFPDYAVLSEEDEDDKSRLENHYVWIIDPLDGTKEFVLKNGDFTVNIALVFKNKPVIGVIYVPVTKELYFASEGNGAFLVKDGYTIKINVSDKKKIENMVLVKSRSHEYPELESFIERFRSIASMGSSLKGCLVAKGKADVYIRFCPLHEWDICAMHIIIIEAGGAISFLDGSDIQYNQPNTLITGFIASNNKIHEDLLKMLAGGKCQVKL